MYKFDKQGLTFVKVSWPNHLWKYVMAVTLTVIFWYIIAPLERKMIISNEVKVIIAKQNEFSEEKLVKLISSLHFPFPHIVMAQAMHETNFFTSSIFRENNNLFGMKMATVRITTSKDVNREHAVYDTWMDSVYDRAFYSATYLSNVKTEDEYYSFLGQFYAEDPEYVNKLKQIIASKQLKERFK